MLAQLRYSGLLEVCRIRKLGFPVRRDFDEFYKRYKCISPSCADLDSLIAKLTEEGKLPAAQFQKGTTKVFMKNGISAELDDFRDEAFLFWAVKVQTVIRGCIMRLKLRAWIKVLERIRAAVASRVEKTLSDALNDVAELPFHGVHLQLVKDARLLQQRLVEEKEVAKLLTNAISQRDLDTLRSAVGAANSMSPPLVHDALSTAASLIVELEAELALKAELKSAIASRDKALIEELLIKAEGMNLECEETRQAAALKLRLEEEDEAVSNLKTAIADRDLRSLSAFLAKMGEMGLETADVAEGRKLEEQLLAEIQAKNAITAAITERRIASIESALKKAASVGLDSSCSQVADANALLSVLLAELACVESLQSSTAARDLSALEGWVAEAARLNLNSTKVTSLSDAIAMVSIIKNENTCKSELTAAAASADVSALSAALQKASELGISAGAEIDAATEAMSKLGAAAEMQTKLLNAGKLTVVEIEALIAEAEGMGIGGSELAAANASLARVKEADALVAAMMACTDFAELSKMYAQARELNIESKYPTEFVEIKAYLETLTAQDKLVTGFLSAVNSNDIDTLTALLHDAAAIGFTGPAVDSATTELARLEAEKEILASISAAIESKDVESLKSLLASADERGMTGDKIQQGRVVADREKLVADTMAKIASAISSSNLGLLNEGEEHHNTNNTINKTQTTTNPNTPPPHYLHSFRNGHPAWAERS